MKIGYARVSTRIRTSPSSSMPSRSPAAVNLTRKNNRRDPRATGTEETARPATGGGRRRHLEARPAGHALFTTHNLATEIRRRGSLDSLNDQIDTTTPHGKLSLSCLARRLGYSLNETCPKRTKAGADGGPGAGQGGRAAEGVVQEGSAHGHHCREVVQERELTVKEICDRLSISRGTLYNYLQFRGVAIPPWATPERVHNRPGTSAEQHPVHTYTPGRVHVSLAVHDGAGSDTRRAS